MTFQYILNSNYKDLSELKGKFLSKDPEGLKLDLGCGFYKPHGYIGIDNLVGAASQIEASNNMPDIYMNLDGSEKLPFKDGEIHEIRSSHFLEHCVNLDFIFQESFRVLRSGGAFNLTVPYANSAQGMFPGHTIFFTERWFKENIIFSNCFLIISEKYKSGPEWDELPWAIRRLIPFHYARKFLFNACIELTLLCVKK